MDEKNNEKIDTGEIKLKKGKFFDFIDNFWYHYKWHSIVALFLLFAVTVCTLQMCKKESYDSYILYAGGYEISRKPENGDIADYEKVTRMLERVAADTDGDGEVLVSLKDLFVLNDREIEEIESSDDEIEVHYPLILENREILRDTMVYSNYYVTLLSPAVYEEYKEIDGVKLFADLSLLEITNESAVFYNEYAIKLSSLEFYTLPGICDMPDDTLLCLRALSAYASHFNKNESEKAYAAGIETAENIINYTKK